MHHQLFHSHPECFLPGCLLNSRCEILLIHTKLNQSLKIKSLLESVSGNFLCLLFNNFWGLFLTMCQSNHPKWWSSWQLGRSSPPCLCLDIIPAPPQTHPTVQSNIIKSFCYDLWCHNMIILPSAWLVLSVGWHQTRLQITPGQTLRKAHHDARIGEYKKRNFLRRGNANTAKDWKRCTLMTVKLWLLPDKLLRTIVVGRFNLHSKEAICLVNILSELYVQNSRLSCAKVPRKCKC